ncbi:MAG TPA: molecular chaperone TorD family protein [Acidimicrobiales bacterium]|nr:molecular chaperone TorD family protein [Acidimicrobiales bacterium]
MTAASASGNGANGQPAAVLDESLVGLPVLTDEALIETMIAAFDLLAHFWSRPVADEVDRWQTARDIELEMLRHLPADETRRPVWRPTGVPEMLDLLDEHERMFVGPGRVPCPPYESFWREDVPVDVRTLNGPCTKDLRSLYVELGLELPACRNELPDHIAVELEALAYALSLEGTAHVARRLFTEHLGHWLPRFCQAVAHESEHGFYRDLAELTVAWLAATEGYFTVLDTD